MNIYCVTWIDKDGVESYQYVVSLAVDTAKQLVDRHLRDWHQYDAQVIAVNLIARDVLIERQS